MNHISLVKPNTKYKSSFLKFVTEVKESGYGTYEHYKEAECNYDNFLKGLDNQSQGIDIEEGWAPCTSYWLVNDIDFIGVIRIRHYLDNEELLMAGHIGYEISSSFKRQGYGTKILELGLIKAKTMGINEVIITCDADNMGSNKIINSFSPEFLKCFIDPDSSKEALQYKILI